MITSSRDVPLGVPESLSWSQRSEGAQQRIRGRREDALQCVRRYVEERLSRRLRISSSLKVEPAKYGVSNLVYTISVDGERAMVLRADRSLRKLRRRDTNHRLLNRSAVPAPTIALADLGSATLRRYGYRFLVERWMPGAIFAEAANRRASAALAGRVFAKMHGNTSLGCGRAGRFYPPYKPLRRTLRSKIQRWIASYAQM